MRPDLRYGARARVGWVRAIAVFGLLAVTTGCGRSALDTGFWNPWFSAVGGSSTSDVYAIGSSTIWHFDGRRWIPEWEGPRGFLNGVWVPSANAAYVAWSSPDGGVTGRVYRFDGRAWHRAADAPAALESVWGSSEHDVFAVGRQGLILHYDGATWNAITTGRGEWLQGIWGSSSRDVFVGGLVDSILHFDGVHWSHQYTGSPTTAVWGSSSNDVFAVGGPAISHYDGVNWSSQASGTTNNLFAVWGSAPDDVFAVGANGTILHYDGTMWSAQSSGTTSHLWGVWGTSRSDVFAVGQELILRYDGKLWSQPTAVQRSGAITHLTAPSVGAAQ